MQESLRDKVRYALELVEWEVISATELNRLTGIEVTNINRLISNISNLSNVTLGTAEKLAFATDYIKMRKCYVKKELEHFADDVRIVPGCWGSYSWPYGYEHTKRFYDELSVQKHRKFDVLKTTVGEVREKVEIELP